ncbi:hypothetical protein U14_01865 [Candidatus Moduliflexus flocculans]|uniref:Methylase n=1 Tax=Candidatus Moduliflexus flocculans TaxID=1499966 RepID=A0A0S6VSZ9_9BACT|nr:hypothetical protein U14_01865 [Candidatus Moduliflexus flocculans]
MKPRRAYKPQGQPTRGKTACNRLRRVDLFLMAYAPDLLRRRSGAFERAYFVDVGYGATPMTTLESAERFRTLNPSLPVLGVEIDPERVAAARPHEDAQTAFRLGGFNLPLSAWPDGIPERARLIRAFNVLRQYDESAVNAAYATLAEFALPGGIMIEGTSDPFGRVWVANIMRKPVKPDADASWTPEALVFSTNFRAGFDLTQFQAVLPKNYIHRVVPGEPIHAFFQDWKQAMFMTVPFRVWGARQWFIASAHALAQRGYRLRLWGKWLQRGWLIWEQSAQPRSKEA